MDSHHHTVLHLKPFARQRKESGTGCWGSGLRILHCAHLNVGLRLADILQLPSCSTRIRDLP